MRTEIREFLSKIQNLSVDAKARGEAALPENCFFLSDFEIVCMKRDKGDSRYPYSADGFTLWAYSSGYISVNESTYYVILPASGGKEPFMTAFGGIYESGAYLPVSLFGAMALPAEKDCRRYTVYTPQAVYYIAECKQILFALRAFVSEKKEVCFTLYAENLGKDKKNIYLSPYINCLLKHDTAESVETNWFKECRATENGYLFGSVEDLDRTTHLENYGVITRALDESRIDSLEITTARTVYTGGTNRPLMCADCLTSGKFAEKKLNTRFTDTAVAAEMIGLTLGGGEDFSVDYKLVCAYDKAAAEELCKAPLLPAEFDDYVKNAKIADDKKNAETMIMEFCGPGIGDLNCNVLNRFVKNVQRQVEFTALAKNSGVSLLGVRDVFQQIEAALMWNPKACREKILEALSFIGKDGRPPRQYSIPPRPGAVPRMDLRPFIDQGVWIIDTLYAYLGFTGDYSLLREECGYYDYQGNAVFLCGERDSVLHHLIRITDYMVDKIDRRYTNCLRAMYGDWNDALDGLGVSADGSEEYGSGVSVMATLQLYRNLEEMAEILAAAGCGEPLRKKYLEVREALKRGLEEHAVDSNGEERKILHGWGDKVSYKIGSYRDPDGVSRDGLTANAFWVISDLYREDDSLKDAILGAFRRLDSKYGLKTFEPYFPLGMKGVGRIVNLPRGTAENAATYVHATLFGIWALFKMGEADFAWEQLCKALPVTHEHLSTTPFVMSNSYSYNEEYGLDGESMSDWFTGSANVLVKVLVRCVFGINPDLHGVTISPAKGAGARNSRIKIKVRGAELNVENKCGTDGPRRFFVNGGEVKAEYDKFLCTEKIYLPEERLAGKIHIVVTD